MAIPASQIDPIVQNKQRGWVFLFSFILAGFLLFVTLRDLDWISFWKILKTGKYEFLFLTLPIASINYFMRSLRWRVLVQSEKKISVLSVFWANMAGYMGNIYLPARAGEILRSALLGKKSGAGTSFVLATALTERVMDAVVLVIIGSVSMLWQVNMPASILSAIRIMAIASIVLLCGIVLVPYQEKLVIKILGSLPLSKPLTQKVSEQASRFLLGMRSLQNIRRLALFLSLTLVIWLVDGISIVIGARIVSQVLNIYQALIFLSALGLSSAIPSTPGYIGVYQFVAVLVLVPFGFTRSDALAYILIIQISGYLIITFWGLIGVSLINKTNGGNE